jgi:hypothetical protein
MAENLTMVVKTQIVLRGLGGLLKSRPLDTNSEWIGKPIYFAHVNPFKFPIFNSEGLPSPEPTDFKKLKFEPTGKVFWKKKPLTAIFEYELTEV